ncbi:hypothetical protein GCM10010172_46610 [Paractinoplanes ferrugineus]|uniref:RibD domain-containing protein n=1 Tax=Paractinoplanes ferrugineus TaxID=113564 RepID=A0A919J8P0_9ACTN|nr:hypothetical protein [Actinoplanes ferrugineus]GIE15815.1 hypothetical protein Afe05nite_76550 [Actinoplanes ferrugineus]
MIFSTHAVSVDGFSTGRSPQRGGRTRGPGRGRGDGSALFDRYFDGDTPGRVVDGRRVPILVGGGRPLFPEPPAHVGLRLVDAVPAPSVTPLRREVRR